MLDGLFRAGAREQGHHQSVKFRLIYFHAAFPLLVFRQYITITDNFKRIIRAISLFGKRPDMKSTGIHSLPAPYNRPHYLGLVIPDNLWRNYDAWKFTLETPFGHGARTNIQKPRDLFLCQ
jgi:hypothetical protein